MNSSLDPALGHLAVELLSRSSGDLALGAEAAIHRRLAGLFLYGLSTRGISEAQLPLETAVRVRQAARREGADAAVSAREIGLILDLLEAGGHRPALLKGRILACELWPRSYHRPPGDLDLLLEQEAVGGAVEALTAAGYRKSTVREHEEIFEVFLLPPEGRITAVDLHWRLSDMVGSGIDSRRLLRRTRTVPMEDRLVRTLDRADQLLFLLVHAAKHGLRRLKWILDLYALALRTDAQTWRLAALRALASRSSRAFHLSAAFLAPLPGVVIDKELLNPVAPAWPVRQSLERLVTLQKAVLEDPVTLWERYAFKILLEESLPVRVRGVGRLLRRMSLDRL